MSVETVHYTSHIVLIAKKILDPSTPKDERLDLAERASCKDKSLLLEQIKLLKHSAWITRPKGQAKRAYNIKDAMGLNENPSMYRDMKKVIRGLCKKLLDVNDSFTKQRHTDIDEIKILAIANFPELAGYQDQWPVENLLTQYLQNATAYKTQKAAANVRAKITKPHRRHLSRNQCILTKRGKPSGLWRSQLPLQCIYGETTNRSIPRKTDLELEMGDVCDSCRQEKCDATRPFCSTSQNAGAGDEYVYRDNCLSQSEQKATMTHTHRGSPSCASQAGLTLGYYPNSISSLKASETSFTLRQIPFYPGFPSGSSASVQKNESQSPLLSFTSFDHTSVHPVIIPNPFVRLVLADIDDPSAFSLSAVSSYDLHMTFRLLFLFYRLSSGIYFPFAKEQAIIHGDVSHTIIHPFFIHFAHLVGCHIYQQFRRNSYLLDIKAMHLQLTLRQLASIREEDDPFLFVQANLFMSDASFWSYHLDFGVWYLKRCAQALERYNIRFMPVSTGDNTGHIAVPEFSEEVLERVVVLGKAVYSAEIARLFSWVQGELCVDIEKQFRYELPYAYPFLFKTCPNILGVRTSMLAKDADSLIASYKHDATPVSSWIHECRATISSITTHLENLNALLENFATVADHGGCRLLRSSIIVSSTSLAELYYVLERCSLAFFPSESSSFRAKCRQTLVDIVEMARHVNNDYFSYHSPFLTACFERVISLLHKTKPPPSLSPEVMPSLPAPESYESHASDISSAPKNFHDASIRFLSLYKNTLYTSLNIRQYTCSDSESVYMKETRAF